MVREDPPHIRKFLLVLGGFLQDRGSFNGQIKMEAELYAQHNDATTRVMFLPWNADWKRVADWIWQSCGKTDLEHVDIRVFPYSWGTGYGLIKLAKELKKRGMNISYVVSSDGVHHSKLIVFRWKAMLRWGTIYLPDNIKNPGHVFWFRQRENRPRGATLIARSEETHLHDFKLITNTHQFMDDADDYHDEVLRVANLPLGEV